MKGSVPLAEEWRLASFGRGSASRKDISLRPEAGMWIGLLCGLARPFRVQVGESDGRIANWGAATFRARGGAAGAVLLQDPICVLNNC